MTDEIEQLAQEYADKELIAYESFLRKASMFQHPFILKGSFATKQFFENALVRYPNDIDWIYPLPLKNIAEAKTIFTDWIKEVISMDANDEVVFEEIDEFDYWEHIDYAGDEDFPTTGMALDYSINGKKSYDAVQVEISFNLAMNIPPVALNYQPFQGESFVVPQTAPLSLQIGWKLHQTLIRPRFKDIFDLIHLFAHPNYNGLIKMYATQELVNECISNGGDINLLEWFVTDKAARYAYLYENNMSEKQEFRRLRTELDGRIRIESINIEEYKYVSKNPDNAPKSLSALLTQFKEALNNALFTIGSLKSLPQYNRKRLPFTAPEPKSLPAAPSPTISEIYKKNNEPLSFWGWIKKIKRN